MKRTIIIIASFTVLIVLLYGIFSLTLFETSAKYTDYKELNHYFESKELYISSKELSSQKNKYNIINYYNFTDIPISIKNSISNKQITNYNIEYQLECKILNNQNESYQCVFDDSKNSMITNTLTSIKQCIEDDTLTEEECINEKYTYSLIESINNHKFKIINNNGNKETLEVEVILNTTSPYFKELKSTYILNIGNNQNNSINISEVKDYNTFCEYNITNNYYVDKDIKLSIDTSKLLFDNTSDIYNNKIEYTVDNNDIINTITFTLNNATTIKLYKKEFLYKCTNNDISYILLEGN